MTDTQFDLQEFAIRLFLRFIVMSLVQLLIYFLIIYFLRLIGIIPDMAFILSIIIISLIIFPQNLFDFVVNRKWFFWTSFAFSVLLVFFDWGLDNFSYPKVGISLCLLAFFTFGQKFWMIKLVERLVPTALVSHSASDSRSLDLFLQTWYGLHRVLRVKIHGSKLKVRCPTKVILYL